MIPALLLILINYSGPWQLVSRLFISGLAGSAAIYISLLIIKSQVPEIAALILGDSSAREEHAVNEEVHTAASSREKGGSVDITVGDDSETENETNDYQSADNSGLNSPAADIPAMPEIFKPGISTAKSANDDNTDVEDLYRIDQSDKIFNEEKKSSPPPAEKAKISFGNGKMKYRDMEIPDNPELNAKAVRTMMKRDSE